MQLAREDIVESNKLLLKKAKAFNTHPETFKDNKREFTRDVVSPEFQAWVRLLRLLSRDLGTVGLKYSSQVVYLNQVKVPEFVGFGIQTSTPNQGQAMSRISMRNCAC